MRIVYFTHSLVSCWNHGNAHFLRGVLRELVALGHDVRVFEPEGSWSLQNLIADHGEAGLEAWRKAYPELSSRAYGEGADAEEMCDGADLVVVHEWNDPALVAAVGRARRNGRFTALFHDTHHRAVSAPHEMRAYDLDDYDAVLAFGEALAEIYRGWGWGDRAFVWHEAADVRLFAPPDAETLRQGAVWIGNWGDGEREDEIGRFLLDPCLAANVALDVYGVRYPSRALERLRLAGARYRGWVPNARAPQVFARHMATVHVPRRFYAEALPGIPTIRVFEALACGVPLVSAPWSDAEGLFRPGEDFLVARDGEEARRSLAALRDDPELHFAVSRSGRERVLARHTCAHRASELLAIADKLEARPLMEAAQ